MKIVKRAVYEYEKNNINEEWGYTKWYDSKSVVWVRIGAVILYYVGLLIVLHMYKDTVIQKFKAPQTGFSLVLFFTGTLIMAVMLPFLRKCIQLLIVSKGTLGGECILNLKNPEASVYNDKTNRKTAVACLIVPGVLFVLVFLLLTMLTHGVQKTVFFLLLFRVFICSADDISNLWCLMRNVGKDDIVFGEYKMTGNVYR